ncbi:MAG: SDR family oxidoreductase [Minwuia sp.]|uniref:SDR family oxidoreductase n=1 Tax=Minwuia sp. TaxID=2493630 RepID=UPI003A8C7E92
MAGRLEGKKCFLTAAAQGIGRATALRFAEEGAEVIATDLNGDLVAELQGKGNITTHRLDVMDHDAVRAMAAEVGAVDVLFNCAGYVDHGALLETELDKWDFSFELNCRSLFVVTKAFLPAMLKNGGGSVVNVASVVSSEMGVVNRCAYGASKGAVIGFTKSVAADYIGQGIRCNAICPATVQTPSLDGRINAFDDPVQARKDFIARQKMGRLATAEEIADLALYLACDESRYITGQPMVIDGGMHL